MEVQNKAKDADICMNRKSALALVLHVIHASLLFPSSFHKGVGHDALTPEFGSLEFYSKLLVSALLGFSVALLLGWFRPSLAFHLLIVSHFLASLLV
jgi:hypothetical protein